MSGNVTGKKTRKFEVTTKMRRTEMLGKVAPPKSKWTERLGESLGFPSGVPISVCESVDRESLGEKSGSNR